MYLGTRAPDHTCRTERTFRTWRTYLVTNSRYQFRTTETLDTLTD